MDRRWGRARGAHRDHHDRLDRASRRVERGGRLAGRRDLYPTRPRHWAHSGRSHVAARQVGIDELSSVGQRLRRTASGPRAGDALGRRFGCDRRVSSNTSACDDRRRRGVLPAFRRAGNGRLRSRIVCHSDRRHRAFAEHRARHHERHCVGSPGGRRRTDGGSPSKAPSPMRRATRKRRSPGMRPWCVQRVRLPLDLLEHQGQSKPETSLS